MFQLLQLSQLKGNNLVYGLVRAGTGWRVILQGSKQAELTTAVSHVPRDKDVTMTSQSAYNRLKSCPSHYVVVRKRSTTACPLQPVHKKSFQKNISSEKAFRPFRQERGRTVGQYMFFLGAFDLTTRCQKYVGGDVLLFGIRGCGNRPIYHADESWRKSQACLYFHYESKTRRTVFLCWTPL